MLRQRKKAEEDTEVLDEQEQEELIQSFERSHRRSDNIFRYSLMMAGVTFTALKLLLAIAPVVMQEQDAYFPPHRVAAYTFPAALIVLSEMCGAVSFAAAALHAFRPSAVEHLRPVCVVSTGAALLFALPLFALDAFAIALSLWFGGLNLCYALVCFYADYSLHSIEKEIQELKGLKYQFKRL
eukprot:TRINITY_DN5525_c0_g1_i1.p1 TRINITY_DN5525_c0_g1~~TRINITY_DN5525_c0_g1_i1.p1  ORF type:complete len:183 (+),score=76.65 TRINITY_DN5525_c0_g1_i1:316-864(+)